MPNPDFMTDPAIFFGMQVPIQPPLRMAGRPLQPYPHRPHHEEGS